MAHRAWPVAPPVVLEPFNVGWCNPIQSLSGVAAKLNSGVAVGAIGSPPPNFYIAGMVDFDSGATWSMVFEPSDSGLNVPL